MRDAIGQLIKVGDTVFYGTTGRYPEFMTCKVIRLTAKTVVVEKLSGNRPVSADPVRISDATHCVVITKLLGGNDVNS